MRITGTLSTRTVVINGIHKLDPEHSLELANHSPDGFMWGYGGSGPSQLALALLCFVTDDETALRLYQDLKWDFVSKLPQTDFSVTFDIYGWLKEHGVEDNKPSTGTTEPKKTSIAVNQTGKKCTPGAGDRCGYAATEPDQCKCDCDGENHGKLRTQ